MRNLSIIIFLSVLSFQAFSQDIFINEIHYKISDATQRGIEIAGPENSKLNNFKIKLYDQNGNLYHTETLNGTIQNSTGTHNAIWFPIAELHNSDNQSMRLEDNNGNSLQKFSFGTGTSSPKGAKSFINIGIVQTDSTKSLQLIGTGLTLLDFVWVNTQALSKNGINLNQIFVVPIIVKTNTSGNGNVLINWMLPQALNTGFFAVERSRDGINYERIETVLNNNTTAYNLKDKNEDTGNYDYRVRWIDDGNDAEILSNSSSITVEEIIEIGIYPNPVMIGDALTVQSTANESLTIHFYNALGSLVEVQNIRGTTTIALDKFKTGTYHYRIIGNNQAIQEGKILIVQ